MSFSLKQNYARALLAPLTTVSDAQQPPAIDPARLSLRQAPSTSSSWTATTHTFVGAGNRRVPSAWPPARFNDDPSLIPDDSAFDHSYDPQDAQPKEGPAAVFHMFEPEHQAGKSDMPLPRLVAKRYSPTKRSNTSREPLTLLMLTGMGLPKEMFEPMIDVMLADVSIDVAEIWAIDMPLSGETALVNPKGYLYGSERDIARDLLQFVTTYLPLQAGDSLSDELQPRKIDTSQAVQPARANLHVVAHSLGAQSAMLIAAHAPELFASLTIFDPAIIPDGKIRKAFTSYPKEVLCTGIKYEHASREALAAELDSNKRVRGWDNRAKRIFVERGAVADPDGKIRLVAHPRLEWALYYDKEGPTNSYDRLVDLKVPLNAVMPARPFAVPPAMFEADLANMSQKTRLTWIPKSTHQLPFEQVDECAQLTVAWLKDFVPSAKL